MALTADPVATLGLLDDADIDLVEAGLALALADRPEADPGPLRRMVSGWVTALARDVPPGSARARARALSTMIAAGTGLTGDVHDYENPLNADLIAVAQRGRGLPVALAMLYVTLARRLGWQADVLNVPGHVLVEVHGLGEPVLVDAFDHGELISRQRAIDIAGIAGASVADGRFPALTNRRVLVRLLGNQAGRARGLGDLARALLLHQRMTALAPADTMLWWERARLERQLGHKAAARTSLVTMLEATRDPALRRHINSALAMLAQ
jgi:regulator of sirC expression with transglutaminase-like and TPR domain